MNSNSHLLLVGMPCGITTLKVSFAVSQEAQYNLSIKTNNTKGYFSKTLENYIHIQIWTKYL
jgi:hypothetical protein